MNKEKWLREFAEGMEQNKISPCYIKREHVAEFMAKFAKKKDPRNGYWHARMLSVLRLV